MWAALALLLALHAFLALTSLRRNSVTLDEFSHLPAGLTYWQKGTFVLFRHNPPLIKMLASLPVLLSRPSVDYGGSWAGAREGGYHPGHVDFGTEFMRSNADRYFALFNRARAVIVLLSVLGGLLVFLWARDLWGGGGGLLAAALWCLDPTVLAHAGVVTMDVGAAVAIFGATYAFWRYLRAPSWKRAALAGVALGLAQLTKFIALSLFALWPLLAVAHRLARRGDDRGGRPAGEAAAGSGRLLAAQALLIPALGLLLINAGYGFEGTGRPLGGFPFLSQELTAPRTGGVAPFHPKGIYRRVYEARQNRFENGWLGRLPVPVPAPYLLGLDELQFESNMGQGRGFTVYLRGEMRRSGWWNYFLYALGLKEPLGTLLLVLAAFAFAAVLPACRAQLADEIAWALPAAAILAGMSLMTGINLGVRYLIPLFPFLFMGASRLARLFAGRERSALLATCLLSVALFWNLVETLVTWPHYLSYFNEAAGGPAGGHAYLIDSNLDWGQDLLELRRFLDSHPQPEPPALAYFGPVDPAVAGIRFRLPPRDPRVVPAERRHARELDGLRPGIYAVSVNFVKGLGHLVATGDGRAVPAPIDAFGYFRAVRPVARAGHSIWIYRLDPGDVLRIRSLWGAGSEAAPGPTAPPPPLPAHR